MLDKVMDLVLVCGVKLVLWKHFVFGLARLQMQFKSNCMSCNTMVKDFSAVQNLRQWVEHCVPL